MKKISGQSIVEYGILIGLVSAALISMNTYMKRGLQAGIKIAADSLGNQTDGLVERDYKKASVERLIQSGTIKADDSTNAVNITDGRYSHRIQDKASSSSFSQTRSENH